MTRGGRRKDQDGPERRCIATGESGPTDRLIRFVLGPDGALVPDIAGKLPGRGVWLTADRAQVNKAVKKRLFSRGFRQPVEVSDDLPDQLEKLLAARLVDLLSLARKAGQAVTGAEKVRARINGGQAGVLLQAADGAVDGRTKLTALARAVGEGAISEFDILTSDELGLAFGREFAIHAALDTGGFAVRVCAEAGRLSGFRGQKLGDALTGDDAGRSGYAEASSRTIEGPKIGAREQDDT
ncbi:MAG: RNA-binding protein [Paracoccaceae bacterium]